MLRTVFLTCALGALFFTGLDARIATAQQQQSDHKISFAKQIQPIFQAHCQGCHQPARKQGRYLMTDFATLLKGGESEEPAIVPGKPEASYLLEQIQVVDGKASMPPNAPPLAASEIELIEQWIAQGAENDSVASGPLFTAENPPRYSHSPVVTSIAFSPDGKSFAVSGYHEVLLYETKTKTLQQRFVGLSERIESVQFSPQGDRLAVAGGTPGRRGEIQVWSLETGKLLLSHSVTADTVYGVSWSHDGKRLAFGTAETSLLAIDAATGEQVLFMGSHEDWVLDTSFTRDDAHIVSVGRDGSVKLTEVETQRFVDNLTSITPGALSGGMSAVQMHPMRNEVVVGGADGQPRTYRTKRLTKRVIGDDGNLVRRLPQMKGRVFGATFSPDGKSVLTVSSLDGKGYLNLVKYDVDGELPDEMKKIFEKRTAQWKPEEKKKAEEYWTAGVELAWSHELDGGLYTAAFHPESAELVVAGQQGTLLWFDVQSGKVISEMPAVPVEQSESTKAPSQQQFSRTKQEHSSKSQSLELTSIDSLSVSPERVELTGPFSYAQLIVTATLNNGSKVDVTRLMHWTTTNDFTISPLGLLEPVQATEKALLKGELANQTVEVDVTISFSDANQSVDFVQDVNPVLSRLGCNQGTCHGSAKGKNGFKLSLRGYDPLFEVRAFTDDIRGRRVNLSDPERSLMLQKALGYVPHVGGQLTTPEHSHYEIMKRWIEQGAELDRSVAKVASIQIAPHNPIIDQIGSGQQFRVIATYTDGTSRDVTREAFIESGNTEIAVLDQHGYFQSLRRGEAPLLARYEGAYASTTLTVMGDRTGFQAAEFKPFNTIDELVAQKWERMKIAPSALSDDAEFLRRVSIDLTGMPPSVDQVKSFLADTRPAQVKRAELIDELISSEAYIEYWSNKWADLLQVNSKFLGAPGAKSFRNWIKEQVAQNTPYDVFVRDIVTASGSNKDNPAASYYKILRDPESTLENTTHLFLGIRFNCNKCHDHPFERWTQDQYYETAAFFARVKLETDPQSGKQRIGGTAVEGSKPLYEKVSDAPTGEMVHQRTSEPVAPQFPYEVDYEAEESATRRTQLAAWMTDPDNPYFAKSMVNRLWGYLFGVGIIDPIDDIRAGNPPSNPELLEYLTDEFISSGFDQRHIIRLITNSKTYQLTFQANKWNEDDEINFSHAKARRLPAEVLYDAIHQVTGTPSQLPGMPAGARAAELADGSAKLPDGFLANFGKPVRESACECERTNEVQLGPVMAMVSGPTVAAAISAQKNGIVELVHQFSEDKKLVEELYLRILNRPATQKEIEVCLNAFQVLDQSHTELATALSGKEEWWKPLRQQAEQKRTASIEDLKTQIANRTEAIKEEVAQKQQQRLDAIANAEQQLKDHLKSLEEGLPAWLNEKGADPVSWSALVPQTLKASTGGEITVDEQGVVTARPKEGKGNYQLVVDVEPQTLTAIRLEVLTDTESPRNGPGIAPDGNFVLQELIIQSASQKDLKKKATHKFSKVVADFSQRSYEVAKAIDGERNASNNGWAVSPRTGELHWAVFEFAEPVVLSEPTQLTITMDQKYNSKKHWIGKFRLSSTSKPTPGLSQPQVVIDAATAAKQSQTEGTEVSKEQLAAVLEFRTNQDEQARKLKGNLSTAKKPVPRDPKLVQLEERLKVAQRPVLDDPGLVQLRKDVEMSQKQLEQSRLTAAEDITWALINSPAFLFNH